MAGGIERRFAAELRTAGRTLTGYASVWGAEAQLPGGVTETVARGAFTDALKSNPDIFLFHSHDVGQVLARTRNGSLRLAEDDRGLHFVAEAPRTTLGDDVLEMVRSGLADGVSIGFRCPPGGDERSAGRRILRRVDLIEISIVATPAYPAASVSARFRSASIDPARVRRLFLDTL